MFNSLILRSETLADISLPLDAVPSNEFTHILTFLKLHLYHANIIMKLRDPIAFLLKGQVLNKTLQLQDL
jgi:hypothetical protein